MTPLISFYFQVHQPYRLRDLRVTDIGRDDTQYFDEEKNRAIFRKVAEKCYLPANKLLLEKLNEHENFTAAFSLSGVFLDQCEEYGQDVLDSFKALADTGKVEFLAETYYHSLSYLWSLTEFCEQVQKHVKKIEKLFGQKPKIFRNTELVYSNELAKAAEAMGFQGILAEGADHILAGRSPNQVFVPPDFELPKEKQKILKKYRIHKKRKLKSKRMPEHGEKGHGVVGFSPCEGRLVKGNCLKCSHEQGEKGHGVVGFSHCECEHKQQKSISILLKNYRLSDDVAFRFSDKSWVGYPLHADQFTEWLTASGGHCVNLYMDYETFGEHQWEDTGIFDFLRTLPRLWEDWQIKTATPSGVIDAWEGNPSEIFDAHTYLSWADIERDLSAWRGNQIQEAAMQGLYELEEPIKTSGDEALLDIWRRLQTSDHFYYMCTKYWNDGDVHKYFSPYESPYEAYRRYSHALCDLKQRLSKR